MINDASLVMIPSGYKDGKLYSVKPTDGSGDFTFSRGSNLAATRVNSEGLIEKGRENLLYYSQNFSNSNWKLQNNATITHNITDPNGGTTASRLTFDALTNSGLYQQQIGNFGTGLIRTASIYLKGSVGGENVMIGDASNRTRVVLTTDWVRYEGFAIDSSTFFIIYTDHISGASTDTIDIAFAQYENGLLATDYIETTTTTAQAGILEDMPRLNYGTCPSLLLEPQRTNIATNSEYMLGFSKGAASSLQGNAAISPDGKSNATYFYCNTTTTNAYLLPSFSGTSGVQYAVSFYAKAKELNRVYIKNVNDSGGQSWFDLSDGTYNLLSGIDSMSIESVGNGWYRCVAISTSTSTAIKWIPILKGDANEGVYVYGLQIESGSYPTSYIPTYGASVTRGADDCSKTGISSLIGQTEGTMYVEFKLDKVNVSNNHTWIAIKDSSQTNRILLYMLTNESILRSQIKHSGTAINFNLGTITDGQNIKVAIAYKSGDSAIYLNGSSIATNTNSLTFGTMDRFDFNDSGLPVEGDINQAILFPSRISNDELAALTS